MMKESMEALIHHFKVRHFRLYSVPHLPDNMPYLSPFATCYLPTPTHETCANSTTTALQ